MQKKLTITLDERVYEGLRIVVGPRRISRFIEALVRPHVVGQDSGDCLPANGPGRGAEREVLEFAEATVGDIVDEVR